MKIWKRIKLVLKEILNVFTNMVAPVFSMFCIVAEVFLPAGAIKVLKDIEYWFFKVSGTKDMINGMLDKVDGAVEKVEKEHSDIKENN